MSACGVNILRHTPTVDQKRDWVTARAYASPRTCISETDEPIVLEATCSLSVRQLLRSYQSPFAVLYIRT